MLATGQPVLCGVDGSSEARGAARFAAAVADRLAVPFVLGHVAPVAAQIAAAPPPVGGAVLAYPPMAHADETEDVIRREGRRLLEDVARGLPSAPVLELRTGAPFQGLLGLADDVDPSMVVLGAAERSPIARAVMGTAWARLVVHAERPVAVVGPRAAPWGQGPVIAGYDRSAPSERAVRVATALANALGRELLIVRVVDEEAPKGSEDADPPGSDVVVRPGEPYEELARIAEQQDAAVIVTGSRGRGPWRAALLGSVFARLVERSPRPVMMVPECARDD